MKRSSEYIYDLRTDYGAKNLDEAEAKENPFEQFEIWLAEAISAEADEPNAMVLATAGKDAQPSARIVLLRGFDENGFVFYTNYESQKGIEIAENPQVSLLFFWAKLERQIRIAGRIEKTSREHSKDYFSSRPRDSQLGAWASAQSRVIESREELEENLSEIEQRFAGKDVECPEFWGGYIVKPETVEFWQGRQNRLHDRLRYAKRNDVWKIERLSP